MKIDFREILFWISLAFTIILLMWYLFGGSPSEIIVIIAVTFTFLIEIWKIGNRLSNKLVNLETRFNFFEIGFKDLSKDFKDLSKDFNEHANHSIKN